MKLYGLIGYPLSHSFSEQYFNQKFASENLADCSFKAFPIPSIHDLPAILKENPMLKGLSVTIPYKEQVLQYITGISDEVKIIGATNSIKISGDNLTAFNTDTKGFQKSFAGLLQPHHKRALVLGTGGASKAVQFILRKLKLGYLVVTRNASSPQNNNENFITYSQLNEEVIKKYQIIINCTPCGMWPNDENCPDIPYRFITSGHYVFDLIYKPAKTLFLKKAEEQGALIKNGYEMLITQAEESWALWNA